MNEVMVVVREQARYLGRWRKRGKLRTQERGAVRVITRSSSDRRAHITTSCHQEATDHLSQPKSGRSHGPQCLVTNRL